MNTELIGVRKPTQAERDKGAEIVFIREDENGNEHIIYGCKCYESWEQSMRINEDLRRQGDTGHYSYFEPECGWNAAKEAISCYTS